MLQWNTRYELPFGPGKAHLNQGVLSNIAGGWAVSTILERNAGQPIRVTYTNVSNLYSSSTYSRPNIVPSDSDKAPGGPHISKGGEYFKPRGLHSYADLLVRHGPALLGGCERSHQLGSRFHD